MNTISMMEKPKTAIYMERIYLAWINHLGKVRSQKEFSDYLELDKMRFNRYYNGARTEIDYQTALSICRKASFFGAENPYELMDILGYPRPSLGPGFESVPVEFADLYRRIQDAIEKAGVIPGSPEGSKIANDIVGEFISSRKSSE